MDLLEQYKQQRPEAFKEKPQWQPSSEYGFLIRLVMRLSGGRIREARQASVMLLIGAGAIVVISILLYLFLGGAGGESLEKLFPPGSPALRE